jgi:hypothetical protein
MPRDGYLAAFKGLRKHASKARLSNHRVKTLHAGDKDTARPKFMHYPA